MSTASTLEPIHAVRLLMADVGSQQYLTDQHLTGYLSLNDQDVRRAAADALDAIATSEALVGKVITSQNLTTDAAKLADTLRKHADRLRAQADRADEDADDFAFDVVDTLPPRRRPEHTNPEVWGL